MKVSTFDLSQIISINPHYRRSVHLERDFYSKDELNWFLNSKGISTALSLLARGVSDPTYRAQCITGPYGSGKSALALYFSKLMDRNSRSSMRSKAAHKWVDVEYIVTPTRSNGYLTILGTGRRENISACLLRSLKKSLEQSHRSDLLNKLADSDIDLNAIGNDSSKLLTVFEKLAKFEVAKGKSIGIMILIDELGKLLEYAAQNPSDSDIHVLQELAELSSRSSKYPIWFITILHYQFSHYAAQLGAHHQQEWSRIQQRFFEVPVFLDNLESLHLIASAINSNTNELINDNLAIKNTAKSCKAYCPNIKPGEFKKICTDCYPLHPTAVILLPTLFRKYGQNERSLFSFLSANEPFSLMDWIRNRSFHIDSPDYYRITDLYDYTFNILMSSSIDPHTVRIRTELEDAMVRLGDAPVEEHNILKAIGILNAIGDMPNVHASPDFIINALSSPDLNRKQIKFVLKQLISKRVLLYRKFKNEYKLWEGSDIDLEERLKDAYGALSTQSMAVTVAKEICPLSPLVARQHSFRTGMLRVFSVQPCTHDTISFDDLDKGTFDGFVLQCLVHNQEQFDSAISQAKKLTKEPSVVLLIGKATDVLDESAREIIALDWISNNTSGLAGDRIARQELNGRRLDAESTFRDEWNRVFALNLKNVTCFWNGSKYNNNSCKGLISLLSKACDESFRYVPIIKNELINRRYLSSQTAAARRNLIEAMIISHDKSLLGIEGYPPERSIYESVLYNSGIHANIDGIWKFNRPSSKDLGLQKVWDYISTSLESSDLRRKNVASLFQELECSPFGLARGFIPILFCAFVIANTDNVALYEQDIFVPEISTPVMERLMRNPTYFSAVSFDLCGDRTLVIERFAQAYNVPNKLLAVLRPLYAGLKSLPQYTILSSNLNSEAINVRETILRAKAPELLLFIDLPKVFNLEPFKADAFVDHHKINEFFNRLNTAFSALVDCYPNLLRQIKTDILAMFNVTSEDPKWMDKIASSAETLIKVVTDQDLRNFLVRAKINNMDQRQYLEAMAGAIVGQAPAAWSKDEEEYFIRQIPTLSYKIRSLMTTVDIKSQLNEDEEGYIITIHGKDGLITREFVSYNYQEKDSIVNQSQKIIDQISSPNNGKHSLVTLIEAINMLKTSK